MSYIIRSKGEKGYNHYVQETSDGVKFVKKSEVTHFWRSWISAAEFLGKVKHIFYASELEVVSAEEILKEEWSKNEEEGSKE